MLNSPVNVMTDNAGAKLNDNELRRLQQLESLAEKLYNSTDAVERTQAQTALAPFSTSSECIVECQFLLNHSKQPYALLLASSSLLKLITVFWNKFSSAQTVDMRNFLLNYLAVNCDKGLPPFVVSSLIQNVCRITTLGWISEPKHQDIYGEVEKFLEHTPLHCVVGLRILTELVDEFNHTISGRTISIHRKVAVSFRDRCLLQVFQTSLASLRQVGVQQLSAGDDVTLRQKMKGQAISLALKCLSYDYIGTNADESAEEFGALQIPSSWRSTLEDGTVLVLFFDMLLTSQPPTTAKCMEVLVQLASCRRSLFTLDELRRNYLQQLCVRSTDIITNHSGILTDHDAYTHFCRLMVAMKANYQLQDLVTTESYSMWIRVLSSFTVSSFNNWQWTGNSAHYLVTLWARLTLSIPYIRGDLLTYLDSLVPPVTQAYIDTRLKAVEKAIRDNEHAEFFEDTKLQEHLHFMPTLCRHAYSQSFQFLHSRIDPLLQRYKECVDTIRTGVSPPADFWTQLSIVEGELAWLFYIVGTVIAGHLSTGTSRQDQQRIDAQLCARVFSCVDIVSARTMTKTTQNACFPYLDLSILSFFQQFRRSHVGQDGVSRGIRVSESSNEPQIYQLLSEHIGQTDQSSVLSSMLQKIVSDLKVWANNARVVNDCLSLLHDLASGYSTSKLLVNLPASKTLLQSHGVDVFPFMAVPKNSKMRTKFYMTWGRLVFSEPHIDDFDDYMKPFDRTFQFLQQHQNFRSDQIRSVGIGVCRDMRGIVASTYNKTAYTMFFEWIYPKYFGQVLRLLETWWDTPLVAVPLLRFMCDFVHNVTQRIVFSPSSPNGIVLFKEASKAIQIYGQRMLVSTSPIQDVYKERYKGIGVCMKILQRALSGDYVNFGVFALYNDKSLANAFEVTVKLLLLFPLPELLSFKKISQCYFQLMEILFRNHMDLLAGLDTTVFLALVSSMMDGLSDFDVRLSSLAATAIDNIASFIYIQNKKSHAMASYALFQNHMRESGDLLPQMLTMLLNLIAFENVPHHWSLSRPILSLILTLQQAFEEYKMRVVSSQTHENQAKTMAAFERLMEDVRPSLDNSNRDKFTQNLVLFRNELRTFAVKPSF